MRILFLTHYYPPEVNAPANRVHEHARVWVNDGHDVTVITGVPVTRAFLEETAGLAQ